MKIKTHHHCRGYTLLEILVTIIVAAIIAVLLMQVMGGHGWRSFWPLQVFDRSLALQESMSEISAHYRQLLIEDSTPLVTLQGKIEDGDYWAGESYASDMQKTTYCLEFDPNGANRWKERKTGDTCGQTDTILRVTLKYETQSLTTLFTR